MKKILGLIVTIVLMFNITYKFWLTNVDRRAGDPEFVTMIQTINTPFFKVSPEEKLIYCYMENPGGDMYHRSLWLAIPVQSVMQIRALSNQEILELQQHQQQ